MRHRLRRACPENYEDYVELEVKVSKMCEEGKSFEEIVEAVDKLDRLAYGEQMEALDRLERIELKKTAADQSGEG